MGLARKFIKSLVGKIAFLNLTGVTQSGSSYIKWGKGEEYPVLLLDAYETSDTLASCIDLKNKFIKGIGYPEHNDKAVNNEGVTLFQFLGSLGFQRSIYKGVACLISYNQYGDLNIETIPFDRWRWKDDKLESILLIDAKRQTVVGAENIPIYKDQATTQERLAELNKKGKGWVHLKEAYIDFDRVDNSYLYPIATFHSILFDADTEARTKKAINKNARSGFSPKVVMTFYGAEYDNQRINTNQNDTDPNKEEKELDNKLGDVYNDALTLMGEEGADVMLQFCQNRESKPDIDTIALQDPSKMYEYAENSRAKKIKNLFMIPDVLFGNNANGIFENDKEKMKAAINYMYKIIVKEDQIAIQKLLNKFLPLRKAFIGWDASMSISQITFEDVNPDAPQSGDKEAEARAALKGSVGGVQGILGIQESVSKGITTIDAGAAILELIYGLNPKQARRILGEPETIEPVTP